MTATAHRISAVSARHCWRYLCAIPCRRRVCGSSYQVAAEELHMHSVKYRVGRAVARRGREIGSDRLEVEIALLACHWYGPAVLQPK